MLNLFKAHKKEAAPECADYVISCCSTVDLTPELLAEKRIEWLPFHFEIDGVSYLDDMGKTMAYADFYAAMNNGADTKTSQVNVQEYVDHFERFLSAGKDIVHVCFSSGLSGTYNSAQVAVAQLREKYPERTIVLVDSLCASSGYGLFVVTLADLRAQGMGLAELVQWAEQNKLRLNHWFFSTDLKFYVKGGRISRTAGLVGTMLHICPLLNMDCNGKLAPREKIRTKKAAIKQALAKMIELADDGKEYRGKVYICHSECRADAEDLAAKIEHEFPHIDGPVQIFYVGTTIGSHTGPGTVSLFFWGAERTD